ncbi:MAG: Mrp/NBP35 family ATP-binding protein [Firmicutes bacterium]|nr:Mrp/NBP35 family ATP-binding protein [Bacillota bacterium]
MANCDNNCGSCGVENCGDRKEPDFRAYLNEASSVKKVFGVMSGKGGVGKSMVTALLACAAAKNGFKTAVMDADVTGPSIPTAFGLKEKIYGSEAGLIPAVTKKGIDVVSLNLLLENESDPVVWRGPVISGVVKQFWTEVIWENEDVMFIDMPPGTGDVALTIFQSLPLEGIVVVTSPQELVGMIVEKAVKMANMMNIPVIGLVENMSYLRCPDCGKILRPFGESHIKKLALQYGIPHTAELPIDPELAQAVDGGRIEDLKTNYLEDFAKAIL